MNIQEIRSQYPQYEDLSDKQIADALHTKHYKDMPKADFYSKIGFSELDADTPSTPGNRYSGLTAKIFGENPQGAGFDVLDKVGSFMSGGNQLVSSLAGMPVDTATNVANLGLAAYGTGKNLLTGSTDMPKPLGSQFLGSQSIKEGAEGLLGPVMSPSSDSRSDQNIHMAGGIMTAGLLAPSQGIKQAAGNMARMVPSAVGAVAMKEMFPDQPLAPALGMMAIPGGKAVLSEIKNALHVQPSQSAAKANSLGYKILPTQAKGSKGAHFTEGAAGTVPTKQMASVHNQKITNDLIKKDINYPDDVPLSYEGLSAIRDKAGAIYDKGKSLPPFVADKKYLSEIAKLSRPSPAAQKFPSLVNRDAINIVKEFRTKQIPSDAAIDAIKQLRANANAGYKSADPKIIDMARTQKKLASAIEGLMERSVKAAQPDFYPEFTAARQQIAKTYQIEKALKGDSVDAVALGRLLDKGKPLSGAMRDVAEFGQKFKSVAQVSPPQGSNFRPMDLVAGAVSAGATGQPGWLSAMLARPTLRKIVLSKAYQDRLTRISPDVGQSVLEMAPQKQAAALVFLLDSMDD